MINVLHGLPSDQNVKKFLVLVSVPLINRGEDDAIARLKSYRVALQQYVLGQTVEPIPFCKADRDNFPKAISFLKPKLDDVSSIRYSLSVMRVIESFKCEPKYSVHTIVDASTADESLLEEISDYIRNWSFLKYKMPKLGLSQFVMSNKAGPNGPATYSAIKDLQALRLHDPKLLSNIEALMGLTTPGFYTRDYETPKSGGEKLVTSKLVCLSDSACKTRVIAIADW
uniref:RdRp n=1 Tax=viral metagenome TaxID=1070528 RepID=A0A2V0RAN1_9ZZZZ